MDIKQDILWRVYLSFLLISSIGLIILLQSFKIQTLEGDYWKNLADSLTTAYYSIEADRGNIYAEDGNLLATSIPFYEIRMDVNSTALSKEIFYNNLDSLSICLANFFKNKSIAEYKNLLKKSRRSGQRYLLIARKVTFPELQKIKQFPLFRLGKYKGGFISIQKSKRITPFKILAHRTIGYVREGVIPVGLEGYYNKYLAGTEGKRLMQRISGGKIPINDDNEIEPKNGKDIVTTLDVYIQDITENALFKAIEQHDANHGCAVVMEVHTGKIKAIANIGKVSSDTYWERYNYAVGEGAEPGSTFKIASMMAVLEDKLISINDIVDIKDGTMKYYDKTMKDAEDKFSGKMTMKKAFEISSNVGMSKIISQSYADNPQKFIDHLHRMNLNNMTGIDIKGESKPYIKSPKNKNWSGTTLPWMSVGYELKLTPLQILTFYNAIANDGQMMRPYLVKEIQEYGKSLKKIEPYTINKKICSDATLRDARILLEAAVKNGTARNIHTENYRIAGKTGTTKIADKKYGYRRVYQASFVGYFPADAPLYSCIVVVNAPSKGIYYGNIVAAPVFREIADKIYAKKTYYTQSDIDISNQDAPYIIPYVKAGYTEDAQSIYRYFKIPYAKSDDDTNEWNRSVVTSDTVSFKRIKIIQGLVPNVVGMGLRDAVFLLENGGLKVDVVGRGKVRKQSLHPGTNIKKGKKITIQLS